MGFISGMEVWFHIWKSVDVIHQIEKLKEKSPYDCLNRHRRRIQEIPTSILDVNS